VTPHSGTSYLKLSMRSTHLSNGTIATSFEKSHEILLPMRADDGGRAALLLLPLHCRLISYVATVLAPLSVEVQIECTHSRLDYSLSVAHSAEYETSSAPAFRKYSVQKILRAFHV
jgi:hypothetical protein